MNGINGTDGWGNPGDMGIPVLWDLSSSTGKVSGSSGDLRKQAESQIEAARAGRALPTMRSETHPNWTRTGATNDVGALYRVGYWLAVGARMALARGGNPSKLIRYAEDAVRKGYATSLVPFLSDEDPRKIGRIMDGGAQLAHRTGLADVAGVLGMTSTPTAIHAAQVRAEDTQGLPGAMQQGEIMVDDAHKLYQTGAGLVTGEKPDHMSEWAWFWKSWGLRIAIGVGVLIVGAVALRPYLGAAQGAYRGAREGYRRNPKPKKGTVPWWLVGGVTALAGADAITPGFPFPGSAALMVPLAGAVWVAKLAEYGVAK